MIEKIILFATGNASSIGLYKSLGELESMLILKALERSNGNRTRAAKMLGIQRTTLVEKIKRSPELLKVVRGE